MNALRILDSIEKHASDAIAETAYTYSYEAGSVRWHQANARAKKAEQAMLAAIGKLRVILASSLTNGERRCA